MPELPNKDLVKERPSKLFPVVGVGASAGGLEAFKRLIRAILEKSGKGRCLQTITDPRPEKKGADFTYYKQTTIRRRIIRRMGLTISKTLRIT